MKICCCWHVCIFREVWKLNQNFWGSQPLMQMHSMNVHKDLCFDILAASYHMDMLACGQLTCVDCPPLSPYTVMYSQLTLWWKTGNLLEALFNFKTEHVLFGCSKKWHYLLWSQHARSTMNPTTSTLTYSTWCVPHIVSLGLKPTQLPGCYVVHIQIVEHTYIHIKSCLHWKSVTPNTRWSTISNWNVNDTSSSRVAIAQMNELYKEEVHQLNWIIYHLDWCLGHYLCNMFLVLTSWQSIKPETEGKSLCDR
jgi:hypothetical protein